jgi:DNA-binding NtrC family response regulator
MADMETVRVLAITTQNEVSGLLRAVLRGVGASTNFVPSAAEGLALLERETFQILFVDLDLPGIDESWVRNAVSIHPCLSVALLASRAMLGTEGQRIQVPRTHYLAKPLTPEAVQYVLAKALERHNGHAHVAESRPAPTLAVPDATRPPEPVRRQFIARSAPMREIAQLLPRIATTDAPVLIQGEPGVGKASVAREIHRLSRRAAGPFIHVACGALRESELENVLLRPFGWEGQNGGCSAMDACQHGTLFLDGVCRLPVWAQVRLFDVLQQNSVAGSSDSGHPAKDFRLMASAKCDLEAAMTQNQFYSGLYYYMNVIQVRIPPLRHRQEDIRALAEHFLAAAGAMREPMSGPPWRFAPDVWDCMLSYPWPGNAWELASVVTHAVVIADKTEIGRACLAQSLTQSRQTHDSETISVPLAGSLKEMERTIVEEVIQRCRGNKAAAARTLGLHRRTLYRLLEDEKTASWPTLQTSEAPATLLEASIS